MEEVKRDERLGGRELEDISRKKRKAKRWKDKKRRIGKKGQASGGG